MSVVETFDMQCKEIGWRASDCPDPDHCESPDCVLTSGGFMHPERPDLWHAWRAAGMRTEEIPEEVKERRQR